MDLESLPELAILHIAKYLSFVDLVNLAESSALFAHLQPEFQKVKGENFSIHGPRGGHFCPETYFDVPILTRGLKSVRMRFKWRDQGFGNQKGQVWLQLLKNSVVVADTREDYYCLAPPKLEQRKVLISGHAVIQNAAKGDLLRVMRNVGGGGGHHLKVRNFRMKIKHKKYTEDDDDIGDNEDEDEDESESESESDCSDSDYNDSDDDNDDFGDYRMDSDYEYEENYEPDYADPHPYSSDGSGKVSTVSC